MELRLAVFHRCQNAPVELKPFGAGFPDLPYRCPCCGILVRDEDYLRFDTLIRMRDTSKPFGYPQKAKVVRSLNQFT